MKRKTGYRWLAWFLLVVAVVWQPWGQEGSSVHVFAGTESEAEERRVASELLDGYQQAMGMALNAERKVYDFAEQFSANEEEKINQWFEEKEAEGQISIRVVTAKMHMRYEKYFLEECADRLCDAGYASEDLVLMLINLDPQYRGVCIQGYGICETRVNDDRIEYILDDVIECFKEDDYLYGTRLFATEAAYYANSTSYTTYYKDNSFAGKLRRMPVPLLLLAPLAIAAAGVAIMRHTAEGRMTADGRTYIQSDNSGITAKRDEFLRTSVSRTYSPRSSGSSSSGGRSSGGGGRSSGGRSHSGGSRRF